VTAQKAAAERLTILCLMRPKPQTAEVLRGEALFGDRLQELLAEDLGVHFGALLAAAV
jgi:hypothetical protein